MPEFTTSTHEHRFGVASVLDAVADERFPVSREKLLQDCGDRVVEVRQGIRRKLREIIDRCGDCEDFSSAEDLISQIQHEMVTT